MFLVSSGFSCVNSGLRVWGSDSPVSDELSTFDVRVINIQKEDIVRTNTQEKVMFMNITSVISYKI